VYSHTYNSTQPLILGQEYDFFVTGLVSSTSFCNKCLEFKILFEVLMRCNLRIFNQCLSLLVFFGGSQSF